MYKHCLVWLSCIKLLMLQWGDAFPSADHGSARSLVQATRSSVVRFFWRSESLSKIFHFWKWKNIRNSSLLLLWFILSKWCFLRPVKSPCLFYVAFWEALLREAKSQRSVGESVKLKDFTGMKVHRSEFILLINSKHLMALQKSFPGWRCLINFVIDYDKSKHPRLLWISKLSVFFKSEEDILKPSSLHCCTVNFWCIKTLKKAPQLQQCCDASVLTVHTQIQ